VLKSEAPETIHGDTVTLALKVGPVPVRFEKGKVGVAGLFGEMTQRDPEFGAELDPKIVARLAGLSADDLDPALTPQVVSTGTAFAIVVLRSLAALERLKVNQDEATEWLRARGARWFYVLAPSLDEKSLDEKLGGVKFRSRMQFYGGEDPATGSAAGCAIAYLVSRGAVATATRVHVRQGVEMGRPSDLFLSARKESAKVSDVRVAGSTVLVAKGQLFLP
jgi:trans-2,3-dihydro-3-hydroxyanthranilate isomerase